MLKYREFTTTIIKLLENDPGQSLKDLTRKIDLNRAFLIGYLEALENQGRVKSKRTRLAEVYFSNKGSHKLRSRFNSLEKVGLYAAFILDNFMILKYGRAPSYDKRFSSRVEEFLKRNIGNLKIMFIIVLKSLIKFIYYMKNLKN
jgi:hypothetical protein